MYLHTERPNTRLTNVVKCRENTIRRSDIKPLTQCGETLQMHVQVFVTLHMSQNWSNTPPPSPQHNCVHSTAPVTDATATETRQYHDCTARWHTNTLSFTQKTVHISTLRFPQNGLDMRVPAVGNTAKTWHLSTLQIRKGCGVRSPDACSPLWDEAEQQSWPIFAAENMLSTRQSLGHLRVTRGALTQHTQIHTRDVPSHCVTGCTSLQLSVFSHYSIKAVRQLRPTLYFHIVLVSS